MTEFQLVVRRVGGEEWVAGRAYDMAEIVDRRRNVVRMYRADGFIGGRNASGVYRLMKRANGRRVRLANSIRQVDMQYSLN